MKASKNTSRSEHSKQRSARKRATIWRSEDSEIKAISKEYENPVVYDHPYPSMKRFAEFLALRYDCTRTCHAYYRQVRLLHEHFQSDPVELREEQLRDYFLHVKLEKEWYPKTIRQCRAATQMFYTNMLGKDAWSVFSQVKTKNHDILPAVLTRDEVCRLLGHIRLRRYRTPLKLIYCCGLRLSECLELTIHDIKGAENKLVIPKGKGNHGRVVPLPALMCQELREYWAVHKEPAAVVSQCRPRHQSARGRAHAGGQALQR